MLARSAIAHSSECVAGDPQNNLTIMQEQAQFQTPKASAIPRSYSDAGRCYTMAQNDGAVRPVSANIFGQLVLDLEVRRPFFHAANDASPVEILISIHRTGFPLMSSGEVMRKSGVGPMRPPAARKIACCCPCVSNATPWFDRYPSTLVSKASAFGSRLRRR